MRSSTRRTILWALALVVALSLVLLAFVQGDAEVDDATPEPSPGPVVPDDPGDGCGRAATTDPDDLSVDRPGARCGPGAPAPRPLDRPAAVTIAVSERSEVVAPVLVADAFGELEAENLDVELVDLDQGEAYEAMAAGDVDVVVGGVDAPFFDAVHEGLDARLVLGGPVARRPNDLDTAQTGLWLRADLISDDDEWDNVESQTVLVPGGIGSAALYPIDALVTQNELTANSLDLVDAPPDEAAERLRQATVGGAWLTAPAATSVADDEALIQVATLPGSESLGGTVFAPRLLGADRDTGVAVARAIIRTINTHLADGYDDEARSALADGLGVDEEAIADGPDPLFDWEVRTGTVTRIEDALITVGGVRYDQPTPEDALVDRAMQADAISPG